MKNINNKILKNLHFFIIVFSIALFISCDKDVKVYTTDELKVDSEYPDLRFANIKDRYDYPAKPTTVDSFQVKSLYHDWGIIGNKENSWFNVNPNSGSASQLYGIGITPDENTDLDDRIDTLRLISEGWEGKSFIVFQKGTAYLKGVVVDSIFAETIGDQKILNIESNQNWSAILAEDVDWMAIEGSASGNGDGTITLKSIKENEELRKRGLVSLLDRNNMLVDSVTFFQNGLFLESVISPNIIPIAGSTVKASIESNSNWNITIPENATSWIAADKNSGENDGSILFTISENTEVSRSAYVLIESVPPLIKDSILISQRGFIPFTEEFFYAHNNATNNVTFLADGSARLTAPPRSDSKNLVSRINNFSYGKYTVNFSNYQLARTASTMLMSITREGNLNGGISLGTFAEANYSDGWATEYWISDGFGGIRRQRPDNDVSRDGIEKFVIDIKRSTTPGMVDIELYINDLLIVSQQAIDGFINGDPYVLTFWIYNYYDTVNPAIFGLNSLIYEPYTD